MYIPGVPCHLVQRGNNREPCFFADDDYQYYLECIRQGLKRYKARLHAYVLMTNHVHLLITPDYEDSLPRMMQLIGRQYVQYINKAYKRTGTLWEGRYKSSLVDSENYLLTCSRYIELNPVNAGMVEKPEEYYWSSYHHNGLGKSNQLLHPHELYLGLGSGKDDRCFSYRELFKYQIEDQDIHQIRESSLRNYPLGNERFKEQIERELNKRIGYLKRGRPVVDQK